MLRISLLIIVAALSFQGEASAQAIPNPVQVRYSFRQMNQVYAVSCSSAPGTLGTWLPVTGNTLTSQQSLIYAPANPALPGTLPPPILYCMAADGKPGLITGAPDGMLLPAQSRLAQYPMIQLVTAQPVNGKRFTTSFAVPFDPDTMVAESGPQGVLIRQEHEAAVYPPGTVAYFGGGEQYGFFRPGTYHAPQTHEPAKTGCIISYMDARNAIVRTQKTAADCVTVTLESLR